MSRKLSTLLEPARELAPESFDVPETPLQTPGSRLDLLLRVPDEAQSWTFATYPLAANPGMRDAYERCLAVGKHEQRLALLAGPPGRGKTGLAIAAMRQFGSERAIFWRVPDFIEWANELAYGRDLGMRSVLNDYFTKDFLLVLDDLGREQRTDPTRTTLFRVLDSRTLAKLPMIVTTNADPNEIDGALVSRFREGRVACRGKDLRGAA